MTRIAAKATRGRGKKCPKGEACASNPETKKHRSKVARLLADDFNASSSSNNKFVCSLKPELTREVLEKFDAIQYQKQRCSNEVSKNFNNNSVEDWLLRDKTFKTQESSNENDDDNASINEDVFSVSNISAASIWSNCTNISFDKFLNGFDPKSRLHRAMLTILATVRDAIDQQEGSETETEYFSGLMLTLNCVDSEEKLTAALALLQMVLKRVQTSVLRLKFSETSTTLMKILSQQVNSSNSNGYLTKSIIKALHTLLKNQELAVWQLKSTQQIFDTILLFVLHSKPRIRKSASFAVISLVCDGIDDQKLNPSANIAAKLTADFCIRKLDEHLTTTNDEHLNIVLYILTLLSDTMAFFPSVNHTKHVSEAILSHMTLGNVLLVTRALHTFFSFFLRRPESSVLSPELNARLLNALYDYQPNVNDDQPLNSWCNVMKEALLSLHNLDPRLFYLHVPKFIETTIACLRSDSSIIHTNICNSIKSIMKFVVDQQKSEILTISNDLLLKLYSELESALKYQYNHAWSHIILMFSEIFIITNSEMLQKKFGSIMQRIAVIYESNDAEVNKVIEQFFAKIIQSHGPRFVLRYCSVVWKMYETNTAAKNANISSMDEYNDVEFRGEFSNAWLLPILRESLSDHSELALFVDHFLPMADELMKKVSICQNFTKKMKDSTMEKMQIDNSFDRVFLAHESCLLIVKELKRCIHAIWSLLPAMCWKPIDVPKVFPKIARRLGETLYNKELSIYVLAGLRNLLKCDENVQKVVGQFSKNFLPILFNVYTNENENTRIEQELRFPVLVLIQLFIPLLFVVEDSLNIFKAFYLKLVFYLNETSCSTFRKNALLDILRTFLLAPEGFNDEDIKNIYSQIASQLIQDSQSPSEQKKGFRLIEEIVMSDSPACRKFLLSNLEQVIEYLFSLIKDSQKSIKSPSTRAFAFRTMHRIIKKFILSDGNNLIPNVEINWFRLLEEMLPFILENLVVKSSKTKKCAREILMTISESYEKLLGKSESKFIELIMNPLKQNLNMDLMEKTSRLHALAFLYVHKYHYPLVSKDLVLDIADVILLCLSNPDLSPPTRPILNICFEFIRHFFKNTPIDLFNSYLEVIICGITSLPVEQKTKYHTIVKIMLTKFCRKFGYELINSMIPEDYQKVMKNIRKFEERKKKQKQANKNKDVNENFNENESDRKSTHSLKSRKSRKFYDFSDDEEDNVKKFVNDEFDDLDEDESDQENFDGQSNRKSFKSKSKLDILSRLSNISIKSYIREEIDGDPIDLLSSDANKNVFSKIPKKYQQENSESNFVKGTESSKTLPYSEDGRLNISELLDQLESPKRGLKRSKEDSDNVDDDDDDVDKNSDTKTYLSQFYKPDKGIHRSVSIYKTGYTGDSRSVISKCSKTSRKSTKNKNSSIARGDVYRSKKASGDMKRRGMPDPYAYYPLNATTINKRKIFKHREEFKAIIKGAWKKTAKGKRLRKIEN